MEYNDGMSLHGNSCMTPDGKWSAQVEVERFLGDTTTRIYINDAAQKAPRSVAKDRVLLYDVDSKDIYFSRDGTWLFTIDHGRKVVYHLPTGAECTLVGNGWVVPRGKGYSVAGEISESVQWPANPSETWRLADLLEPDGEWQVGI